MPLLQIERELLEEAATFVDCHSESWYKSGQELLGKLRAVLNPPLEIPNPPAHGLRPVTLVEHEQSLFNGLRDKE